MTFREILLICYHFYDDCIYFLMLSLFARLNPQNHTYTTWKCQCFSWCTLFVYRNFHTYIGRIGKASTDFTTDFTLQSVQLTLMLLSRDHFLNRLQKVEFGLNERKKRLENSKYYLALQ